VATNLQLDDELIAEAVRLGGHRSKREAVNEALLDYTRHLRQLALLSLFGTIEFAPGYDYKKQRSRV
jgi:hypothetical protein